MISRSIDRWRQPHQFDLPDARNERRTFWVVLLTVSMMIAEIAAGTIFGSMALLADGIHMGTHAAALGITLIAYIFARRMANDRRFTFGTGKMGVLGGFSSAVVLLVVALLMGFETIQRLFAPQPIRYIEAIIVAGIGLSVNLLSAFLLRDQEHDHPGHGSHDDDHHEPNVHLKHEHQRTSRTDHNLRAAYLHVLADALTSILAVAALAAGMIFGWYWMDAVMGLVGAIVITRWSVGLMRDTGGILLDRSADDQVIDRIRQRLETDSDNRLADLHVWRIGSNQYAALASIVTENPKPVDHYRSLLGSMKELAHLTFEIHDCNDEPCLPPELSPEGRVDSSAGL